MTSFGQETLRERISILSIKTEPDKIPDFDLRIGGKRKQLSPKLGINFVLPDIVNDGFDVQILVFFENFSEIQSVHSPFLWNRTFI